MRLFALTAIATLALAGSMAFADDVTRDSYTAQVEPICKVNGKANQRILKNVRRDVKKGRLKVAGKKFIRASAALKRALRQLRAVPQPAADTAG